MGARFLYWLVVLAWAGGCWWWYVCHIKHVCSPAAPLGPAIEATAALGIEEKMVETSLATDMSQVQIEELPDQIIIHYPYNEVVKHDDQKIDSYLKKLAAQLKKTGQQVTVEGHTDNQGSQKSNLAVSERRAKIIRDVLKNYGVLASRIKVEWYGEARPKETNYTKEGKYQNRRVEIILH